jgi:RNA polymerase sigma-70 factor, ECF subfamily
MAVLILVQKEGFSLKAMILFKEITNWFNPDQKKSSILNQDTFDELYARTYLSVFRYLYGLHGGPVEDVEDLTAETYLRAWKSRRSFTGNLDGAATGWLLLIGRRLVIDKYRHECTLIPEGDELPEDLPQLGPTPEHLLLLSENYETLWILMQKLPGRQREMIVLRYFLDWRVNQIGEYLKIPENTVSVTIHRGIMKLQNEWPEEMEVKDVNVSK